MTLAPNAIVDDIHGVHELVKKIEGHPLWDCYVLPSVIGLALRIAEEKYCDDPEM